MRVSVYNWLGQEFVEISAEGPARASATAQTEALFADFARVLDDHGLSLADTVRSRIFGRDRKARDAASEVRGATLSGPARAASSSYIAPALFASDALTAMDLIALRPAPGLEKVIREMTRRGRPAATSPRAHWWCSRAKPRCCPPWKTR